MKRTKNINIFLNFKLDFIFFKFFTQKNNLKKIIFFQI